MRVPPMENFTCAAFEENNEVLKTMLLDFLEDDVMWVASKLSGAAGSLGSEAIEMSKRVLRFGCASEEIRVVFANMAD